MELTCPLRFPNSILRMQQPSMLTGKDNGIFCFHLLELQMVQYSKVYKKVSIQESEYVKYLVNLLILSINILVQGLKLK